MQAKREAGVQARAEIPACLVGVERAALEEDVRRLGNLGCLRQHLVEQEAEVRVTSLVRELRRHRMRSQPRRDASRIAYRA